MGKTARVNRHGIEQIHLYQFADTKLVAALKLKQKIVPVQYNHVCWINSSSTCIGFIHTFQYQNYSVPELNRIRSRLHPIICA